MFITLVSKNCGKLYIILNKYVAMILAPSSDEFKWENVEASCVDEDFIYIYVGLTRDEHGFLGDPI